jgi:integrase
MSDNSTRKPRSRKAASDWPEKPYKEFPLYPHPLGYWSKKVAGVIRHYGRWGRVVDGKLTQLPYEDGWETALKLYKAQIDDHKLGQESSVKLVNGKITETNVGLTINDLCNRFRTAKKRKLESGRITQRSYDEYTQTTDRLVRVVGGRRLVAGLRPEDFDKLLVDISKTWGLVRVGNEITRVKSVFKHGRENGWITKPIPYGSEFKKPDRKEMRKDKATKGKKMLEAAELRRLIDAAPAPAKAMLLLGLNCGFGNHDCATLPESAVNLEAAWVDFPRPKTGIERRCPLWPETVEALREVMADRPEAMEEAAKGLVFVTARGRQFLSNGIAHPVTCVIVELMKRAKVHRAGIGFYTLRHVFRTIADETLDRAATDRIMGHADHTMGAHYRERIDDSRLQAVAEHVRQWLWPKAEGGGTTGVDEEAARPVNQPQQKPGRDRPALRLFAG